VDTHEQHTHLLLFSGKTGLVAFMRKLLTLNREMGVSMAEIARYLGGLRLSPWQFGKKKEQNNFDDFEQRPTL
jgi:hypothetical protein